MFDFWTIDAMFSCSVTSCLRSISAIVLLVAYLTHANLPPDVISGSESNWYPPTFDDELAPEPETSEVDSSDDSLSSAYQPDSAIDHLTRVFGISHKTTTEVESRSRDEFVDAHRQRQARRRRRSPPEYMVELYKAVAYSDGISKTASPYEADLVRGISDKASFDQVRYHFNVSHINNTEVVLEAELHLFKMRPGTSSSSEFQLRPRGHLLTQHIIDVRLYEVLSEEAREAISATQGQLPPSDQLRLLVQRRVSAHRHGWEVFKIRDTVRKWIQDPSTNHGLLVSTRTLSGELVNGTLIRFAQKSEHHDSKQPVLVVFSDEDHLKVEPGYDEESDFQPPIVTDSNLKTIRRNYVNFLNEAYRAQHGAGPLAVAASRGTRTRRPNTYYMNPVVHQRLVNESTTAASFASRQRRSSPSDGGLGNQQPSLRPSSSSSAFHTPSRRRKRTCQRYEMYVDFEKIGWSGWIISPKGYNAYQCRGVCPFPLGQNQHPSNHATVQSIVHALRIAPGPSGGGGGSSGSGGGAGGSESAVDTPCCVPNKLYSISLLYFDDDENVILKQYDEMVAASCGCH